MKILVFSVFPLQLLDLLGEYLAREGNDVIYLTGKRSRDRTSPGVRRIIMNFDEAGFAAEHVEAWKQALKNAAFGLKALKNIEAWQPDIILCRAGQGAAFFVKTAFPAAFLASFAADAQDTGIDVELDSRLFLESGLRFAKDKQAVDRFPPLLREAIQLEPICIETNFFRPGTAKPFSCWKLDPNSFRMTAIVLTGLSVPMLQAWTTTIARFLAKNRRHAIVGLADRGVSARLVKALGSMRDGLAERIFITSHLEKEDWRNLCASMPVVFTSQSQKVAGLECVAAGGSAWLAGDAELADVPGARLFDHTEALESQIRDLDLTAWIWARLRALPASMPVAA